MAKRELADRSGPCRIDAPPLLLWRSDSGGESRGTVSVAPPYHTRADDESAIARGRADSRFWTEAPDRQTMPRSLALNESQGADDRPDLHYRRRRGGPPGLGRDATTQRPLLYLAVDVDMPRRSPRTSTMRPPSTSSLLEPDARLRSPRARPPSTIGCSSHFSLSRLRLLTHTLLSHIKKP